eukprot:jgi/Picsp_1/2794/NSC_01020-R1_impact family member in pol 5 region-like
MATIGRVIAQATSNDLKVYFGGWWPALGAWSHKRGKRSCGMLSAGGNNIVAKKTLPAGEYFCEAVEVKKSKFVAFAWHIDSVEDAIKGMDLMKDLNASHNCFAYKLNDEAKSSDDGEPGGTAGRPILSVIEGMGMDEVAVMVTRYFGGIKLGTGGLVRAYTSAAREVLNNAEVVTQVQKCLVKISAPMEMIGVIYNVLESMGAEKQEEIFDEGSVSTFCMTFLVDASKREECSSALRDSSRGKISIIE